MPEKQPMLLLASIATLTLALNGSVTAEEAIEDPQATPPATAEQVAPPGQQAPPAEPAAPVVEAAAPAAEEAVATQVPPRGPLDAPTPETSDSPKAEVPVSPPSEATAKPPFPPPGIAAARERVEARRAEVAAERIRRYEDLRTRAAEVGLDLPETPPWVHSGVRPPEFPSPPAPPPGEIPGAAPGSMGPENSEAMRERAIHQGVTLPKTPPWKLMADEERKLHWETMRNMSPEERGKLRDEHWQEMRKRAQEQGVEMPETPPWRQAEQKREEMLERWEQYRRTVEEMTPEQKEAVQAIFGTGSRTHAPPPAGRQMPMQRQFGSWAPQHPMMQGYGPQGAGAGLYPRRNATPWSGSGQWMNQAPPVFNPGHQPR